MKMQKVVAKTIYAVKASIKNEDLNINNPLTVDSLQEDIAKLQEWNKK